MTVAVRNSIDLEVPPPGVRLEISVIAGEIGVSVSDMAEATGISRTSVFSLITENAWPKRADQMAIREALRELFVKRGASDEQLRVLFHAHVSKRRGKQATGYYEIANPPKTEEVTDVLLPKQTLTLAAKKAFHLFANPFDGEVIDDTQMFLSDEIRYVREAVMQTAKAGSFVALVSESGGGKTTVLGDLEARIERDRMPVQLIKPWVLGMEDTDTKGKTLKSTDILSSIITTLDPLAAVPQTLQARSNLASKLLSRSAEAGFSHLLVIEEAHSMSEPTLKHLKRLNEMKLGRKPLLGILLLGQTELGVKLDPRRASLREVTQRCEVVNLLPLDADLQAYLEHRAKCVNRELREFIDATGIDEIRARLTITRPGAGGKQRAVSLLYPLAVNNLVTAALNTAAELGAPIVNRDVVRAV